MEHCIHRQCFMDFFVFLEYEKATLKMKKTDFQDEKVAVLLRKRGINENFEKTSGKYFQNYAVTMKSSMKGNLKKGEKMVGVLIATHGGFAEGILNAVELIAGKQEGVKQSDYFMAMELMSSQTRYRQHMKNLMTEMAYLFL